jgi:hypothetical protein
LKFLDPREIFSVKELRKAIFYNMCDSFREFGKYLSFFGEEYPPITDNCISEIDEILKNNLLMEYIFYA